MVARTETIEVQVRDAMDFVAVVGDVGLDEEAKLGAPSSAEAWMASAVNSSWNRPCR